MTQPDLYQQCCNAHGQCALRLDENGAIAQRQPASTEAFFTAAFGSGDFTKGVIAALSCIGGPHAPLIDAFGRIVAGMDTSIRMAEESIRHGLRLAGWGNSFIKGQPDPIWIPVGNQLAMLNPELVEKIDAITDLLHKAGKRVFPNAACWTAAACITLGIPAELSPMLFIQGRLPVWARIFQERIMKPT